MSYAKGKVPGQEKPKKAGSSPDNVGHGDRSTPQPDGPVPVERR